jgi:hypothetical protein
MAPAPYAEFKPTAQNRFEFSRAEMRLSRDVAGRRDSPMLAMLRALPGKLS